MHTPILDNEGYVVDRTTPYHDHEAWRADLPDDYFAPDHIPLYEIEEMEEW